MKDPGLILQIFRYVKLENKINIETRTVNSAGWKSVEGISTPRTVKNRDKTCACLKGVAIKIEARERVNKSPIK